MHQQCAHGALCILLLSANRPSCSHQAVGREAWQMQHVCAAPCRALHRWLCSAGAAEGSAAKGRAGTNGLCIATRFKGILDAWFCTGYSPMMCLVQRCWAARLSHGATLPCRVLCPSSSCGAAIGLRCCSTAACRTHLALLEGLHVGEQ